MSQKQNILDIQSEFREILQKVETKTSKKFLDDILDVREIGNTLFECQTIDEIFDRITPIIEKKLQTQVISLFLISKDNRLERKKIYGVDKNQESITDEWLKEESYELGTSFSGIAAASLNDKPYGETHFSNTLERDVDKLSYGNQYIEKLGFLKCGISVPLNGVNKTFGTLEVINKVDPDTGKPSEDFSFSEFDIYWLTIVGSQVAQAIARLRRKWEEKIVSDISIRLADSENENFTFLKSAYDLFAEHLVHEYMPYKVCIIRLCFDNESLQVISKAKTEDIKWDGREDKARTKEKGIVGEVLEKKELIKIEDIQKNIDKFLSTEWIKAQKKPLKSFICYPLVIRNKIVGTISLFTGYCHTFTESDLLFLKNISLQLAVFKTINDSLKKDSEQKLKLTDYEQISQSYKENWESIEQQYEGKFRDQDELIIEQKTEIGKLTAKIKELEEKILEIPIPEILNIGSQNNQKSDDQNVS